MLNKFGGGRVGREVKVRARQGGLCPRYDGHAVLRAEKKDRTG